MSFKLLHNYFTMQFNTLLITLDLSGFHPVGGWGGSFPPKTPSFPPQKRKRERRKEEKERESVRVRERERESERDRKTERERKKEREVHGVGRGACIFLRRIASDQYSLLLRDSII